MVISSKKEKADWRFLVVPRQANPHPTKSVCPTYHKHCIHMENAPANPEASWQGSAACSRLQADARTSKCRKRECMQNPHEHHAELSSWEFVLAVFSLFGSVARMMTEAFPHTPDSHCRSAATRAPVKDKNQGRDCGKWD